MTIKKINASELKKELKDSKSVIIDVRSSAEYEDHHLEGSYNIPLDVLETYKTKLKKLKKKPVFVCKSGMRSTKACQLIEAGKLDEVDSLEGGLDHWQEHNLDIIYGKKSWTIERQVRLTAGFLVTLGIGLSYLNPNFKFISLFIGIGLMFAAITNTCAMGILISKMPWNKCAKHDKYKSEVEKLFSHH